MSRRTTPFADLPQVHAGTCPIWLLYIDIYIFNDSISKPYTTTSSKMTLHKHSEIFKFFSKILPNEELLYHSPLPPHRQYDPATTRFQASRLIMSLVPSEAVYDALNSDARSVKKVLFLHRPWKLDRRRVPVRPSVVSLSASLLRATSFKTHFLVVIAWHTRTFFACTIRRAPNNRLERSSSRRASHSALFQR